MTKLAGAIAAVLLSLGLVPVVASAHHGPDPVTAGDVTAGVQLGQGCIGAYAEKSDVGYKAVSVGGYGVQYQEGSHYNAETSDMNDPNGSLCPAGSAPARSAR